MNEHFDGLALTVVVDADEWAYSQRRLTYLHCMLLRVIRDEVGMVEWYSAEELASLRLPGLPDNRAAITRKARAAKWTSQVRPDRGERYFRYHVASLPGRAFDTLISRILDMPEVEEDVLPMPDIRPGPEAADAAPLPPENTAPAWVLPLMRLMKGEAKGDLGKAWTQLPDTLPAGTLLPTVHEAAAVLISLGLAGR